MALAQWTVVDLHPAGADQSYVNAASGDRQGGYATFQSVDRASTWRGSAAGRQDLSSSVTPSSYVFGLSGEVAVGQRGYGGGARAILWRSGMEGDIDLTPEGACAAHASDISGNVVVGAVRFLEQYMLRACIWNLETGEWADLHPPSSDHSVAYGVAGDQQVGMAYFGSSQHAGMWLGTADSWRDLHPQGYPRSHAYCTDGVTQGGMVMVGTIEHASIWTGSSESWTDLHPGEAAGFSMVVGIGRGMQVGAVTRSPIVTAALWRGTASSLIDLGALLPSSWDVQDSFATCIAGDDFFTYVGGYALQFVQGSGYRYHAILWTAPHGDLACSPADVGGPGGEAAGDGILDNTDFIVYISAFFDRSPGADRGVAGGIPGADGEFDNNDFIVFIDQFFAGC